MRNSTTDTVKEESPILDDMTLIERNNPSPEIDRSPSDQIHTSTKESQPNGNSQPTEGNPIAGDSCPVTEEDVDRQAPAHDHSAGTSTISSDDNIFTPREEVVTLDARGDIRLIVGSLSEKQVIFIVSSSCLRLASAKWSALLDSAASEETQPQAEIDLLENDVETARIILLIAHLQFDKVPTCLSFEQLLDVAVFCGRHETSTLVHPLLKSWAWPWESKIFVAGYEQWIFIAWVFGFQETFEVITVSLAGAIKTNSEGECLIPGGVLSGSHIPGTIIESIFRIRNRIISNVLTACYDFIDTLSDAGGPGSCEIHYRSETATPEEVIACDSMALGSFLRGLRPLGVWPVRPEPMAIHMSANELIHELSAIRVFVYPKHSEVDSRSHMCTTEDQLLLNIHLDAIGPCNPSTLLDEHKEHFSKCRTRSLDPWIRGSDAIAELGFVSRDYLDISSDSEGDEDYDPLEDETDEPAEEFLECDTEYYVSDDENSDNEGGTVEQD